MKSSDVTSANGLGFSANAVAALDRRACEIFRGVVEGWTRTGDPVGSAAVSDGLRERLSPASVRSVMARLEEAGLLYAPHASAGRVPTERGLRLFVDAMLETTSVSVEDGERIRIAASSASSVESGSVESRLAAISQALSGLSRCAGVVLAPRWEGALRQIEFARLDRDRALMIFVGEDGMVENRVISLPSGMTDSALSEASEYLNRRCRGRTLSESLGEMLEEIRRGDAALDVAAERIVSEGLAVWGADADGARRLIVRGRSRLLEDVAASADLERVGVLLDELEGKKALHALLSEAGRGESVRIFIGSESELFSLSGSSLIAAAYRDGGGRVVGALGVIGPTRLNYARVIPMVDYTARLIEDFL